MAVTAERNHLLGAFPRAALDALAQCCEPVRLARSERVVGQGERLTEVCFPLSGVTSTFQVSAYGRRIETSMIGREGMTGVALLLGADRSPEEVCCLVEGDAVRVDAAALLAISRKHESVRNLLLRYVQASTVQTANTALSHGLDKLERRLARWLMMCRDRLATDDLPLTHDQLSTALGVRRSGVTSALHVLEGERWVRSTRGRISIVDHEGLRASAADSYGAPEAEYVRLLGVPHSYPWSPSHELRSGARAARGSAEPVAASP